MASEEDKRSYGTVAGARLPLEFLNKRMKRRMPYLLQRPIEPALLVLVDRREGARIGAHSSAWDNDALLDTRAGQSAAHGESVIGRGKGAWCVSAGA